MQVNVSDHPSISIVIPNYNGQHLLEETIRCAYESLQTSGIIDAEIIVTDDCSSDQSEELVRRCFPEVIFLRHESNTGFSGNTNRGIKAASKDWILLLNSDVHLSPAYFHSQLHVMNNEKTFGVMGLILDAETKEPQDGAKCANVGFLSIESNKNIFSKEAVLPTFFLSGANALIRRTYLIELGAFNESFNPYYSEDVDLGIRAWRRGYFLYFQPQSICFHAPSSTIRKLPSEHVRMIAKRNKHFLHFLHLPAVFNWLYLGKSLCNALIHLCLGKTLHWKALVSAFRQINNLQQCRRNFSQAHLGIKPLSLLGVKRVISQLLEKQRTDEVRS